jgi:hypothetical protein
METLKNLIAGVFFLAWFTIYGLVVLAVAVVSFRVLASLF